MRRLARSSWRWARSQNQVIKAVGTYENIEEGFLLTVASLSVIPPHAAASKADAIV